MAWWFTTATRAAVSPFIDGLKYVSQNSLVKPVSISTLYTLPWFYHNDHSLPLIDNNDGVTNTNNSNTNTDNNNNVDDKVITESKTIQCRRHVRDASDSIQEEIRILKKDP